MNTLGAIKTKPPDEREANPRLSNCQVCGGEIFRNKIKPCKGWWHEKHELDKEHKAVPIARLF